MNHIRGVFRGENARTCLLKGMNFLYQIFHQKPSSFRLLYFNLFKNIIHFRECFVNILLNGAVKYSILIKNNQLNRCFAPIWRGVCCEVSLKPANPFISFRLAEKQSNYRFTPSIDSELHMLHSTVESSFARHIKTAGLPTSERGSPACRCAIAKSGADSRHFEGKLLLKMRLTAGKIRLRQSVCRC